MKYKRKLVVIACVFVFVGIGIAASKPPAENFKNLKVLPKNISEKQLDKVMDEFKVALGVECGFCHVHTGYNPEEGWDMASDAKPEKSIARKMISMANKINKKFFHGKSKYGDENAIMEIHCVTCHHGQAHPEMQENDEKSRQ